jgi:transaldolase
MATPQIDALRQQFDEITSEYGVRFAGQARATREVGELDSLIARSKELSAKLQALPEGDAELEELKKNARENVDLYVAERAKIIEAKNAGPELEEFAALGTTANFVFARYRRHFAGKSRNTRDLGLLDEMIEDLNKVDKRMRDIYAKRKDGGMQEDMQLVSENLTMYKGERSQIAEARGAGNQEQQADTLAECANEQFKVYADHFAGKSRSTRRPALLQRLISNLRDVKAKMLALKTAGFKSDVNENNIKIVNDNLNMYESELAEIKKVRASTKLIDLMGNLGAAANDVMQEYRENFAGQDRSTRDLDRLSKLADQMGEIMRQMSDLGRVEKNEMNTRNLAIVTDNVVMFENEYREIQKAKGIAS